MVSIKNLGAEPVGGSPSEFQSFLKTDVDRWTKIIKAANIKDE
jgi:tripartite-type tricarboxylate transporter receptor subunit TctC